MDLALQEMLQEEVLKSPATTGCFLENIGFPTALCKDIEGCHVVCA